MYCLVGCREDRLASFRMPNKKHNILIYIYILILLLILILI